MKKKLKQEALKCFHIKESLALKKLLLMTKLTLILIFLSFIQALAADSYAQMTRLSLQIDAQPLEKVLEEIEEESEFFFLYNKDLIDVEQKVSVNVQNETIKAILDEVLNGKDIAYTVYDRQIVLSNVDVIKEMISQQRAISGKVSDSNGQPLPGVTVYLKGSSTGSITDIDGHYSISGIPVQGSILVFSFIGMKTQEIDPSGKTEINVVMEEDAIGLEEVVAIGYGVQKKVNLTGSVQSQTFDEAVNTPVTNSAQLMYGRFSGIQLTQNSGLAGSDASSVIIRGVGTFGDTNPLIVIDGMQYDDMREFNQLSPSDIESISVLKDASAGAIYGARGANGVIIISTKNGKPEDFKVELNSYIGFQRPTVIPKFMDGVSYAEYINDLVVNNAGGNEDAIRYTDEEIEMIRNGSNLDQYSNTDWTDAILKDAFFQNHYLSFSGGSKKTVYRLSMGYLSQDAIVVGNFDFKRYNFLSNLSSELTDWISINNNFSAVMENQKAPTGGESTAATMLSRKRLAPTIPVKYANGYYGYIDGSYYTSSPINPESNPIKVGEMGNYKSEYYNLKERFNIILNPVQGLTFETALSINLVFKDISDFSPYDEYRDWDGNILSVSGYNKLTNQSNKTYKILNDNLLKYQKTFGDNHDFAVMLGHSVMYDNYDWFSGSLENFPSESLEEFNAGGVSNPSVAGSQNENALQSFFSRVNYSYKDRYLLEMNVRRDGSSRFGPGNRYGTFPSFSLGWRLSEEPFIKENLNEDVVSQIKLRGSWGRTGNNGIGNYVYDQTYNAGLDYVLGSGTIVSGAALTSLANTTIRWETTEQTDIGINASFFSGKLYVEGDYFRRRSYDVLYTNFPVPATIGVSSIAAQNSAEIFNSGTEWNIGYSHHGAFSYNVNLNFTKMAPNNVVSLGNGVQTINDNAIITEGEPYLAYYGYRQIGIFQSTEEVEESPNQFGDSLIPGDLKYEDVSGPDGVPDGIVDADDRVVIGNPYPGWLYGLSASLTYKSFDLGFTFQGIQDVDRIVRSAENQAGANESSNLLKYWENRWTEENPSTELFIAGGSKNNVQKLSTFYIEDASFLRLKNIEIGYSIPERIINRMFLQKCRLYISGQNLLTFTKMENFDPERLSTNTGTNNVPIYRSLTCGVNIVF